MNLFRIPLLFAGAAILLAVPLRAQNAPGFGAGSGRLNVHEGDEFTYKGSSRTEIQMQMPHSDSTMTRIQEMGIISSVEASDISDSNIVWQVTTETSMTRQGMGGGQPKVIPIVMTLITDRAGKFKSIQLGGDDSSESGGGLMSMMMNGSSRSTQGPGWFMPEMMVKRKVGESWKDSAEDTTTAQIRAGMNIDLIIRTNMSYTYEGVVDTLGVRAARLNWSIDSISFEGSVDVPGTTMTIDLDGKGTGTGVTYYSLADRILTAQSEDMEMTQTVAAGMMGTQDIHMKIHHDQVRDN